MRGLRPVSSTSTYAALPFLPAAIVVPRRSRRRAFSPSFVEMVFGPQIRAAAVHACRQLAARLKLPERVVDMWLWNRGQAPEFKAVPRHRSRTVFY